MHLYGTQGHITRSSLRFLESGILKVDAGGVMRNYANHRISDNSFTTEAAAAIQLTHQLMAEESPTREDLIDDLAKQLSLRLCRHHLPTYHHSLRVAKLVKRLAQHLYLGTPELPIWHRAALLHDLGKITIPLKILNKPTALSQDEWFRMDQHCQAGSDLLRQTRLLDDEAYVVLHHHRWHAAQTQLSPQYKDPLDRGIDLIAVCDAYDALVSQRPYRQQLTSTQAMDHLKQHSGSQFNPRDVAALQELLSQKAIYFPLHLSA